MQKNSALCEKSALFFIDKYEYCRYFTTTGSYLGTSVFITVQPIKYATAQMQNTIMQPAGFPGILLYIILALIMPVKGPEDPKDKFEDAEVVK